MSGHLLNLDSSYIHVIWVEQLLQETQTFTRGFLCMLVREELKLFSTSVRTSPFPSLKTIVSGHLLDLVCIGFWWLWLRLAFGFWPWTTVQSESYFSKRNIATCAYVLLSWYALRGEALRPPPCTLPPAFIS